MSVNCKRLQAFNRKIKAGNKNHMYLLCPYDKYITKI